MAPINDKELEDIIGKCSAWLPKAMEQVGCSAPGDVTSARCKKALRDTLKVLLVESYENETKRDKAGAHRREATQCLYRDGSFL